MTVTHVPPKWKYRLLAVLNAMQVAENYFLLDAWAQAEGGTARWNMLNTSYQLPGSTDYNTSHVQNYLHPIDGICATALTLCTRETDGTLRYGGILGALQIGTKPAAQIVQDNAAEFSQWGTSTALILQILG